MPPNGQSPARRRLMVAGMLLAAVLGTQSVQQCQVETVQRLFRLAANGCGTVKDTARLFEDGLEIEVGAVADKMEKALGRKISDPEIWTVFDQGGDRAASEVLRQLWESWPHFRREITVRQVSAPTAMPSDATTQYNVETNDGTVSVFFVANECVISGVVVLVPALEPVERLTTAHRARPGDASSRCDPLPVERKWPSKRTPKAQLRGRKPQASR
jgi:hypothetical protein